MKTEPREQLLNDLRDAMRRYAEATNSPATTWDSDDDWASEDDPDDMGQGLSVQVTLCQGHSAKYRTLSLV